MAAEIIDEKCTGCGICEMSCPGDLIFMDSERTLAVLRYPEECWYCGACRLDCPEDAIRIVFPISMI